VSLCGTFTTNSEASEENEKALSENFETQGFLQKGFLQRSGKLLLKNTGCMYTSGVSLHGLQEFYFGFAVLCLQ